MSALTIITPGQILRRAYLERRFIPSPTELETFRRLQPPRIPKLFVAGFDAVTATDIKFNLSKNTGPGNSSAQGNVNDSIGGFMSSTQMTDATLSNLYDIITGDENAASTVDYRLFFIWNSAAQTLYSPKVWISSEVAGGASSAIALDGTGVVAYNSAVAQAERIANELTAPAGEVFSSPTTKAGGLAPADLTTNTVIGIWSRRTAANTAAVDADGATWRVEGDSAA